VLRDPFMEAYWSQEYGEIKYQIGGGCLTDQILGQWHADLVGLGDVLSPDQTALALRSIFAENFRPTLKNHFNPCRVYAYEDEAGLLVCTWPEGTVKPATPVPYSEEVWTGLEYMLASHLIARGFVDEGLAVVSAARARHNGSRRNPWNEIECGSYYARSLSSYALLNAYLGMTFDQRADEIGFHPARGGEAVYFWSAGRGWGEIEFRGGGAILSVKGGELVVSRLRLPTVPGPATIDGRPVRRDGDTILLDERRTLRQGQHLVVGAEMRGEG
jgi:familyl 116 glycosyl hydrolase-like protein